MEGGLPHYSTNVISTSAASYPSPSAVSPHQLQHGSSISQTLPPLQPNNLVMQQPTFGGYPTPRTPATPNTPGSTSSMASYPPPPPQNGGRGSYPMMSQNPYQQTQQSYATSSTMLPQTTTASSHPQPIAPAPAPGGRVPPVLRPMPASGVIPQPGVNSPYGQSPLMPQPAMLPEGDQPTHVVGSQGRRGILPSAPGRPAAPAAGTAPKAQIPQKDADGKFPCPHCTKTYLHAKHLKRHLLRHTGDRPYMCVLCRDTFSRSDILKRHFQKCSIRRGNPTGASHLSHPQAHVKKNAAAQQKAMGNEGDVNHINGMGNMPADGMVHPFGLIPAPASDGMSNIANDQSQLSRSSSMNRLDDANRDRRSMTGPVMGASQNYNGEVPNGMSTNINPQLANYSMPQQQNGMPMFGGPNSNDWSSMFQAGAHNTYINANFSNDGQTQTAIKPEPNLNSTRAGGVPGSSSTEALALPSWGIPSSQSSSYQHLSSKIADYFFRTGALQPLTSAPITQFFHPDNIREFLEKYTHFHTHFSMLHIPTFRATDAFVGLVAGMCCLGACYSDRVSSHQVRDVMNVLRASLLGSSRTFASLTADHPSNTNFDYSSFGTNKSDLEELQAIVQVHILFVWHGTPSQRETARKAFPLIASLARKAGLLRVSRDTSLYSPLHQPDLSPQSFNVSSFDWTSWVEQEKRVRAMYIIFLCDASLGLYFNTGPEFDTFEIRLPLPADDAAWDAASATECADALGLHGLQIARVRNPDGTQRGTQPEMHLVLKALLDNSYQIHPGVTNLYGKFILIHGLIAMMRRVQLDGRAAMEGSSTPIPQNAWFAGSRGENNTPNSGRATSVDLAGNLLDGPTLKTLWTALDKFKASWDKDMVSQFPPTAPAHPRRYGFSKDGIHFYWLATYLLKNTRLSDLEMAPDERLTRVIQLLKSVKQWVMTDGASRREELGSVGEIDSDFGASQLTLDMAQLFKPLPRMVESTRISSA